MENKFKPGDNVMLKSGGLIMTVEKYLPDNSDRLLCNYSKDGDIKTIELAEDVLKLYEGAKISFGSSKNKWEW